MKNRMYGIILLFTGTMIFLAGDSLMSTARGKGHDAPAKEQERKASREQKGEREKSASEPKTFVPSEEVSSEQSVAFPVDI